MDDRNRYELDDDAPDDGGERDLFAGAPDGDNDDTMADGMRIGRPEELEQDEGEEYGDPVADARARLTVDDLLARLTSGRDEVALRDLFVLSDLTRDEAAAVEQRWADVPVARRRRLVEALVESAEERFELQLGRLLRIALRDSDAGVRRSAIEGLWEEVDANLIGLFVQTMTSDPSTDVRAAAAAALGAYVLAGELDELDAALAMRAEQALLAILEKASEPLKVQCRALESLAYSSEAGMRQLIEDAYYAPQEELRLSAMRAMGRSADTRWRGMVRAELTSPEPAMRAEAARACGELEVKTATAQIIAMLDDREQMVRLAAIEALGHLGGKDAREALRAVSAEGEPEEAEAADEALDEMLFYDEPGAIPLYEEDDDEEEDDEVEPWRRRSPDDWDK